jgi:hypothetical protein
MRHLREEKNRELNWLFFRVAERWIVYLTQNSEVKHLSNYIINLNKELDSNGE